MDSETEINKDRGRRRYELGRRKIERLRYKKRR